MQPRGRLLLLFLLCAVPLVVGIYEPAVGEVGILMCAGLFALALLDVMFSPDLARVLVEREAGEVMSVGARNPVKVWLRNENPTAVQVEVHDEPPAVCDMIDLPFTADLRPNRTQYVTYHVKPHNRGKNRFGRFYLRAKSRLGLWQLIEEREAEQPVRIYPDIQAVQGVELLARMNRLAAAGVRLSRLKGRGTEFDRLREYRRGDEYRSIDWKATAKQRSLISREYVVERNQTILFLLDCGRSMCNSLDGISHFDRALNAAILMSYVALRQGDTVGLLACSNTVQRWVPPLRGAGAVQSLVRQTYDLESEYTATDYNLIAEQLRLRHRKRSLVVLVTHAMDEVHMKSISAAMRKIRRPHLVLGAFVRNVPVYDRMNTIPSSGVEAFQVAAAADMIAAQSAQVAQLEQNGLLVVDALPDQLSSQLITRYLDIKARHLL